MEKSWENYNRITARAGVVQEHIRELARDMESRREYVARAVEEVDKAMRVLDVAQQARDAEVAKLRILEGARSQLEVWEAELWVLAKEARPEDMGFVCDE